MNAYHSDFDLVWERRYRMLTRCQFAGNFIAVESKLHPTPYRKVYLHQWCTYTGTEKLCWMQPPQRIFSLFSYVSSKRLVDTPEFKSLKWTQFRLHSKFYITAVPNENTLLSIYKLRIWGRISDRRFAPNQSHYYSESCVDTAMTLLLFKKSNSCKQIGRPQPAFPEEVKNSVVCLLVAQPKAETGPVRHSFAA